MTHRRAVVTGAAGFVGSHLCDRLVGEGLHVVGVDNLVTGDEANLAQMKDQRAFRFQRQDVSEGIDIDGGVDVIYHLASPASPVDYLRIPIETLRAGSRGTENALELARRKNAVFLLASTSEVYGDPTVHPQTEDYWGNVNPIGTRSCYDEAKRYAEALAFAYHRVHDVPIRVARIFNTYGPRMRLADGRVVPTFLGQALSGTPLSVYGSGLQTRSFCYVSDLVDGLWRLGNSDDTGPINLGNPTERTMIEFANEIIVATGSRSEIAFAELPTPDDPKQRRPDISRARELLGWEPHVSLQDGLRETIAYFRSRLTR